MQKIFDETNSLDQACYTKFSLTPDLLMEHAAQAMAAYIRTHFNHDTKIAIVTGSGHNGADGIALARLLHGDYRVSIIALNAQKSELGILQEKRAKAVGVTYSQQIQDADVIVDAIFGSGLNRPLDESFHQVIEHLNAHKAFKLSCDLPSGILNDGRCSDVVFKADVTITMGALKSALFSDQAKEFSGEIIVADLGVSRALYEKESAMFLLDQEDLKLPFRTQANTHKGSFGHSCIITGDKEGASIMAGLAALSLGSGLVTLVTSETKHLPIELMQATHIPKNCTALSLGMGLGALDQELVDFLDSTRLPLILDADLFYERAVIKLLDRALILTPHPKEFCSLLKLTQLADITIEQLQTARLYYVKRFAEAFPKVTLLLKGANVIIASEGNIYINPYGSAKLSKGGSGDVLAGFITALVAQGYSLKEAAISGSLAHTQAASQVSKNSYALLPTDIIQAVAHI